MTLTTGNSSVRDFVTIKVLKDISGNYILNFSLLSNSSVFDNIDFFINNTGQISVNFDTQGNPVSDSVSIRYRIFSI